MPLCWICHHDEAAQIRGFLVGCIFIFLEILLSRSHNQRKHISVVIFFSFRILLGAIIVYLFFSRIFRNFNHQSCMIITS